MVGPVTQPPPPAEATGGYVYSSKPQPVAVARRKYRTGKDNKDGSIQAEASSLTSVGGESSVASPSREPPLVPINILHDPRVYHGTTYGLRKSYATNTAPPASQTDPPSSSAAPPKKAVKRRLVNVKPPSIFDLTVEDPLRQEISLEPYLIEQHDYHIRHREQKSQTDNFKPRPPTPPYVPAKTGVDTSTVVQEDLFDFDREVEPLLAVLVQKTLDQAVLEVDQEEELVAIQKALEECLARKAAEEAVVKKREELTATEYQAKQTCLEQERQRLRKEIRVQRKVHALQLFRRLAREVFEVATFPELERTKKWRTPCEQDIRANFMPWVLDQAVRGYRKQEVAHGLLDDVLASVYVKQQAIQTRERAQQA